MTEIASARLRCLVDAVTRGDTAAVGAFWTEVAEAGTPLVEPIEDEPDHRLVTFLWRGEGAVTDNVVVFGGPALWWDVPANRLELVTGTDVWFGSYRVRADLRGRYVLSPNDPLTDLPREGTPEVAEREKTFRPDPLNPRTLHLPSPPGDLLSVDRTFSVLELPAAPPQTWAAVRADVPPGELTCHRVSSALLGNERRIWVHTPAGYSVAAEPYGLAVLLDGRIWAEALPIAATLDNLAYEHRIPPVVVAMVDSLDFATRQSELTLNEAFPAFLTDELIPWLRRNWHLTENPARTLIQGQSYGGLAAAFVGLRAGNVFGNVSIHSGSFWWPSGSEFDTESEWLTREYATAPVRPVRFYLEVGLQEGSYMLPPSRHLRDVLRARGYPVHYREYNGGHDANCWRGGIADGLQLLTADW